MKLDGIFKEGSMTTECSQHIKIVKSFKLNEWRSQRDTFYTHVQGVRDELQTLQTIRVLSANSIKNNATFLL